MRKAMFLGVLVAAVLLASPALADNIQPLSLSFGRITGSGQADQVKVNLRISQVADDQLLLEFTNQSLLDSVVSEIYFQDSDGLVKSVQIQNEQNVGKVNFREGARPSDLPGGTPYNFNTSFAMEAKNPSPKYGVNPNETLKVLLNLGSSAAVNSLITGLQQQNFRVGLHVQSIGGQDSASFINTPPPGGAVPEPGTLVLVGSALLGSWGLRRRLRRRGRA